MTWSAGLPSSSSHALIGGLVGAGLVAWIITLPAAALVAAGVWKAADTLGGRGRRARHGRGCRGRRGRTVPRHAAARPGDLGGRRMIATVVDIAALWKILLCALAVGVRLTAVYGAGAAALGRLGVRRRARRGGRRHHPQVSL